MFLKIPLQDFSESGFECTLELFQLSVPISAIQGENHWDKERRRTGRLESGLLRVIDFDHIDITISVGYDFVWGPMPKAGRVCRVCLEESHQNLITNMVVHLLNYLIKVLCMYTSCEVFVLTLNSKGMGGRQ